LPDAVAPPDMVAPPRLRDEVHGVGRVIIRVLHARVPGRNVAQFNVLFRRQVELLREQPGLEYVKLARRLEPDGSEEVLLFEEWLSPGDVYRWAGRNLAEPRLVPGALELIDRLEISHYEALDREVDERRGGAIELPGTSTIETPGGG
jgi:heme-degrading monooxygenase HmoA